MFKKAYRHLDIEVRNPYSKIISKNSFKNQSRNKVISAEMTANRFTHFDNKSN